MPFRSDLKTPAKDRSDVREFIAWLVEGDVKFSLIGSNNATTYKETFRLIRDNRLWKGATGNTTDMVFGVPKGAPVKDSDRLKAKRLSYPSDENYDYTRLGNSCWFTNIDHGRRHEPLRLMTMAENVQYSKHKVVRGVGYQKYDNYDAIEIPFTDAIPEDHKGVMGVPITFLDKYNPDQFEIVGLAAGNIRGLAGIPTRTGKDGPYIDGKLKYGRILIRRKDAS
jgi:hypothetical protein